MADAAPVVGTGYELFLGVLPFGIEVDAQAQEALIAFYAEGERRFQQSKAVLDGSEEGAQASALLTDYFVAACECFAREIVRRADDRVTLGIVQTVKDFFCPGFLPFC